MKRKKIIPPKGMSYQELENMFPNEEETLRKLFEMHHGTKTCPCCKKQTKYHKVRGRKCFECGKCGYQIYPCKGTVMENSKIPVRQWLRAIFLTTTELQGLSSQKLARALGIGYKAAYHMNVKIRSLMKEYPKHQLTGVVEIDETYCGGKNKAKKETKKVGHNGRSNKIQIVGIKAKAGEVRSTFLGQPTKKKVIEFIIKHVKPGTTIYTDESALYVDLKKFGYLHATVNHSKFQWADGPVTTNRIEGIWSHLKRGWKGVYIHISRRHIKSYLAEFDFKRTYCKRSRREVFETLMNRLFSFQRRFFSDSLAIEH